MAKKVPKCKGCGEEGHYKIQCRTTPRTPIKQKVAPTPVGEFSYTPAIRRSTKVTSRRKQAVIELDTIFSVFIRMRDSEKGIITCVSCPKRYKWQQADNCHFIDRRHIGTRWDEYNCNAGCQDCNRYNKEKHIKNYQVWLESTYGEGIVEELKNRSKRYISTFEIEEMIIYYRGKVAELSTVCKKSM